MLSNSHEGEFVKIRISDEALSTTYLGRFLAAAERAVAVAQ